MTPANHFSRDCIGVRLRAWAWLKGLRDVIFQETVWRRGGAPAAPKPVKSAEHKGFTIEARPYKEGGQFQLAGVISKEIDGVRKEHSLRSRRPLHLA